MKRNKNWLVVILSGLAILFSITAVIISLSNTQNPDNAFFGWIVATLTSMVLLLIGWQIYTFIDVKNRLDNIEKNVDVKVKGLSKLSADIQERALINDGHSENAISRVYLNLISPKENQEYPFRFLLHSLLAMTHYNITGKYDLCNQITDIAITTIDDYSGFCLTEAQKNILISRTNGMMYPDRIGRLVELRQKIINIEGI
ncbi:MAG: hypothetical protein LBP67_05215 [Bacteroidales bacterium]|jgi:hypothetical protein|nr:hypothetical protein [Bacteroidales bacterium]